MDIKKKAAAAGAGGMVLLALCATVFAIYYTCVKGDDEIDGEDEGAGTGLMGAKNNSQFDAPQAKKSQRQSFFANMMSMVSGKQSSRASGASGAGGAGLLSADVNAGFGGGGHNTLSVNSAFNQAP